MCIQLHGVMPEHLEVLFFDARTYLGDKIDSELVLGGDL